MKRIFWIFQAAVLYLLTLATALLPAMTTDRFGAMTGRLLSLFIPKRRAIAIDSLSHALSYLKAHTLWLLQVKTFSNWSNKLSTTWAGR